MRYKKGSIVPRTLVKCYPRKTAYLLIFGCDVDVKGKTITALNDGSMMIQKKGFKGGKKGKPRVYCKAAMDGLYFVSHIDLNSIGFKGP